MNNAVRTMEKQLLRGLALRFAHLAGSVGAGTDVIKALLKQDGFNLNIGDIQEACGYLEGKGLIRMEHPGNAVLKINRDISYITPKGVDVLEGTVTVEGIELVD